MISAVPHFLTTSFGQVRIWVCGSGLPVLVLPGLIRAAETVAAELSESGLTVHVLDLPGTGGSSEAPDVEAAVAEVARLLGLEQRILAYDLSAALAPSCVALEPERASGWAARGYAPPDLSPRADGTHLTALHAHLRNAHILDPANADQAAKTGAPLPDPEALNAALLAAASNPAAYEALWRRCLDRAASLLPPLDLPAAIASLRMRPGPASVALPAVQPHLPIWRDHAELPRGRMHLRIAGVSNDQRHRPLVALHSAPGGSAPLTPLLLALGADRRVIAPDYLGNGLSSKPDGPVDIARLARDILDLLDTLELREVDLWGTHTGALIALEVALIAPDRVHRLVLEAPPLLPPAFTSDILAHYLPPIAPDCWGLHLLQAWNMRRDMFLFWPWYRRDRAAARPLRLPDAGFLHDWTLGLLASGRTYDRSYRAAFEYDTRARLPTLTRPALVCAGPSDMLADGLAEAGALSPMVRVEATPATVWYPHQSPEAVAATLRAYADFLAD